MRRWSALYCAAAAAGCGGDPSTPLSSAPAAQIGCAIGERTGQDGACIAAGVAESGCAAGEAAAADGSCVAAGIGADACARGFVAEDRACKPVLPEGVCPSGTMAVPGDTQCREVGACSGGVWPELDGMSADQYVDGSFAGATSDGSMASPWKTIQAAIDAATSGATIAIAAGTYAEDVDIASKPVRLRGVCAAKVEIAGTTTALTISGSDAAEVADIALTSGQDGLFVSGSSDVVVERVWVHDAASRGINLQDTAGPASVEVRDSLVERTHQLGVFVAGSTLAMARSVVRDSEAASGVGGHAIHAQYRPETKRRSAIAIRDCVIERSREAGIMAYASDALVEATVVRDTSLSATSHSGNGIHALVDSSGERAIVTVVGSYVEGSHGIGIGALGSDLDVQTTTIVGTIPLEDGVSSGIAVLNDADGIGWLQVSSSVTEAAASGGVATTGTDADVRSVLVRNPHQTPDTIGVLAQTHPLRRPTVTLSGCELADASHRGLLVVGAEVNADGLLVHARGASTPSGGGALVVADTDGQRAMLRLSASRLDRLYAHALGSFGSDVEVEATSVSDIESTAEGVGGIGFAIAFGYPWAAPATLTLRHSTVERTRSAAVMVLGADVLVDNTLLREIRSRPDGGFGDGVAAVSFFGGAIPDAIVPFWPATVTIARSRVEAAQRCGVSAFAATVSVAETQLECNPIDLDGEPLLADDGEEIRYSFADQGANRCGCGLDSWECSVKSTGLTPPGAVGVDPQ
jgi:hypothetical protein